MSLVEQKISEGVYIYHKVLDPGAYVMALDFDCIIIAEDIKWSQTLVTLPGESMEGKGCVIENNGKIHILSSAPFNTISQYEFSIMDTRRKGKFRFKTHFLRNVDLTQESLGFPLAFDITF